MAKTYDPGEAWAGPQIEYEVFEDETIEFSGKVCDKLQWLKDLGTKGWRCSTIFDSLQETGMFTDDKKPIKKWVLHGFFWREKL